MAGVARQAGLIVDVSRLREGSASAPSVRRRCRRHRRAPSAARSEADGVPRMRNRVGVDDLSGAGGHPVARPDSPVRLRAWQARVDRRALCLRDSNDAAKAAASTADPRSAAKAEALRALLKREIVPACCDRDARASRGMARAGAREHRDADTAVLPEPRCPVTRGALLPAPRGDLPHAGRRQGGAGRAPTRLAEPPLGAGDSGALRRGPIRHPGRQASLHHGAPARRAERRRRPVGRLIGRRVPVRHERAGAAPRRVVHGAPGPPPPQGADPAGGGPHPPIPEMSAGPLTAS